MFVFGSTYKVFVKNGVYSVFSDPQYTLTINPTPADATVTFSTGTVSGNSCTVVAGTSVTYTVSKSGYTTQTGTVTVNADQTVNVTLLQITGIPMYGYTYTYNGGYSNAYLLWTSISSSGYTVYDGTIQSISGTIGASGSTVKGGSSGYTYTYNSTMTIGGVTLYIYKYGNSEIGVLSNSVAGGYLVEPTNFLFSNSHPTAVSSSSMSWYIGVGTATFTGTRNSSIDKMFTGS